MMLASGGGACFFLSVGHVKDAIGAVEDEEVEAIGRSQFVNLPRLLIGLKT